MPGTVYESKDISMGTSNPRMAQLGGGGMKKGVGGDRVGRWN